MRIGLVSLHPSRLSGQIDSLVGLAEALTARGHAVELAATCEIGPSDQPQKHLPLPLRALQMLNTVRRLPDLAQRVDLIHLNLPTPAFSFAAEWLQRQVNVPVVAGYEAHLTALDELRQNSYLRSSPRFYLPYLLVNNRWVAKHASYGCAQYVVASQYQAQELLQLGVPDKAIAVIGNLVDTSKLHRSPRSEARAQLGLPDGKLITYYGHFHHVKGLDLLIRAFPRIAASLPDAHLAIAWSGRGSGKELHRLIQQTGVAERIIVLGKVDVGQFLSASDVAVFPYRLSIGQQAFPNCVLEAIHLGVPLVTGDLPLLREICVNEETAMLASCENEAALGQAILRVLVEPRLRDRLQHGMHHLVQTRLHPHRLVEEYEGLYEQILQRQTGILQAA